MTQFTNDSYVIQAADLAPATFCGRAWSAHRNRWESVHNAEMVSGQLPRRPMVLRSWDIRVLNSVGGIRHGVRIMVMTITDPLNTGIVTVIGDGVQSAGKTLNWHGVLPMDAGIQWRIHQGALVAGDVVAMAVCYE